MIRLGFVSARAAFWDGGLWLEPGVGRVLAAWQAAGVRLTVGMSGWPARSAQLVYRLDIPPADVVPLPQLPSVVRGFVKAAACRRAIGEVERRSDVVVVQLPFAAPLALLGARRPRVYHACADIQAVVAASGDYRGASRVLALAAARGIDALQRRLIASPSASVVANGAELWGALGARRGRVVVSSVLRSDEIDTVSRRRPADAPFRLLYVGYLRRYKGLDTLIDAYDRVARELPAELVVVGAIDQDRGLRAELVRSLARRPGARLVGPIPFGPELFQHYADADALALPSRSDGTPRVLVEARAFGCPVAASRVGGIPTSVHDGVDGLLVPPGDAAALAAALLRLAREPDLRARLVAAGLRRAAATTVDKLAAAILDEARQLA